jgi:hypothetical protein
MSNLWIRVAYSVLLALAVALTVGFGIMMVITGPRPPDTPSLTFRELQSDSSSPQQTDQLIGVVDRFYQDAYDFRRDYPDYQRNLLVTAILLAMIVGGVGIALQSTFNFLRLGLTLGAILLIVWATAFALSSVPNAAPTNSGSVSNLLAAGMPPGLDFPGRFLRFAASFVALLVFLFLGLWRLTEWTPAARTSTERPSDAAAATAATTVEAGSAATIYPTTQERVLWQRPDDP